MKGKSVLWYIYIYIYIYICFIWQKSLQWAMAFSFTRLLDHTQRRITVGRTVLGEWSARRRNLYLTTHNNHNRQISMTPVEFEPTISAGERPQTCASHRASTETGTLVHNASYTEYIWNDYTKPYGSWRSLTGNRCDIWTWYFRVRGRSCVIQQTAVFRVLNKIGPPIPSDYIKLYCLPDNLSDTDLRRLPEMKVLANASVFPVWICATSDRLPTYVSGTLYLEEAFIGLHPDLDIRTSAPVLSSGSVSSDILLLKHFALSIFE